MVWVKTPYGTTVEVTDEQAATLGHADVGYGQATPEDVGAEQEYIRQNTVGRAGLALGAGALRGATLGASDVAIGALGGSQSLRDLQQYHPFASGIGEAGGVLGATLLTGGGAAAEYLPARAAMRLGAFGERVLGAVAGKTAGVVGRGVIEGGLFGAGSAVSELAMDDSPLTGEKVAASLLRNVGHGALFGGAAAGAFEALGAGATKAVGLGRKGLNRVLAETDARKLGLEAADEALGGATRAVAEHEASAAVAIRSADDAIADAAKLAANADEELTNLAAQSRTKLQAFAEEVERNAAHARAKATRAAEDIVLPGKDLEQMERAADHMSIAGGELRLMADDVGATVKQRKAARDTLKSSFDDGAHYRGYTHDVEGFVANGASGGGRRAYQAVEETAAALEKRGLGEIAGNLRRTFDDEAVWGEASKFQRGRLAARANPLEMGGEAEPFTRFFKGGKLDGKAWERFMREAPAAEREEVFAAAKKVMHSAGEAGEFAAEHGGPGLEVLHRADLEDIFEKATKATQARADFEEVLSAARDGRKLTAEQAASARSRLREEVKQAHGDFRELRKMDQRASRGGNGGMGLPMVGWAAHQVLGPAGPLAVGALSLASRPAQLLRGASWVRGLVDQWDGAAGGGIRDFFAKAGRRARNAASAGQRVVTRLEGGKREKRGPDYIERRRQQLMAAVSNSSHTEEAMQKALAPLGSVAPKAASAAAERLRELNKYLLLKLPDPASSSLAIGHMPTLSPTEIDDYLRLEEGTLHPERLPDLMTAGRLTAEHVQGVKDNWPLLYKDMQEQALQSTMNLAAANLQLPHRERMQLGIMFDIPTDPSLAPESILALQAPYKEQAAAAPAQAPAPMRGGAGKMAPMTSMATGSEMLEGMAL